MKDTFRHKIESHSSHLNNKRLQELLLGIDSAGLTASNTGKFNAIVSYYNVCEQTYINTKDVYVNDKINKEIAKARSNYTYLYDKMTSDPRARIQKNLTRLLRITRKYNSLIITALQSGLEYFFRIGQRDTKGLLNIKYYDDEEPEENELDGY